MVEVFAPTARSGVALISASAMARVEWDRTWLRALVYLLVVVQLLQGALHVPNGFAKAYWLIDYSQGFVRRGITGEFLRRVAGAPTDTSIAVASACVGVVCVASVLVLIELLLRLGATTGAACAVLLACSPFVIDRFLYQRRPDQLGVPIIVVLGLALVYTTRWRLPLIGAVGLLFGVLCLVHEGVALYDLPIAVALVVLLVWEAFGRGKLLVATILLVTPSVVAVGSVLLAGRPTVAAVQQLRQNAQVHVEDSTMFDFLSDSIAQSLQHVTGGRHAAQLGMLVLGAGVVMVHRAWLNDEAGGELFQRMGAIVSWIVRNALGVMIGVGVVITFALGVDWLRWFAETGCAWLVASAFLLLKNHQSAIVPAAASYAPSMYRFPCGCRCWRPISQFWFP